jgi:hypothetical protein
MKMFFEPTPVESSDIWEGNSNMGASMKCYTKISVANIKKRGFGANRGKY